MARPSQVLIEKEWLAFGHPFHLRHAYGMQRGVTSGKEDQRSPIFLQFLDCTWQLVMQLPSYFEFNPRWVWCAGVGSGGVGCLHWPDSDCCSGRQVHCCPGCSAALLYAWRALSAGCAL